ncbi:MAG: GlxA family transcriptional regulator [Motiliproteus sp.]
MTAATNQTVQPASVDLPQRPEARRFRIGFLVQSGFEMLGLALALSVLRRANQFCGANHYHWHLISPNGESMSAANGLEVQVHQAADRVDVHQLDAIISCGGETNDDDSPLLRCLHRAKELHLDLGAFGSGCLLLARAGALNGYSCAAHWDHIATLREQFPLVRVKPAAFEIDRNRFTCSGGCSALDLMLDLVTLHLGSALKAAIADSLICERVRDASEQQLLPVHSRFGDIEPKLSEAIVLMEANLEEPVTQGELASYIGISARQLERIFQKYLGRSPTRYYLELRMNQARQMLTRTNKSIIEVAVASGFLTNTHFSRRYREFYGITPREARKRHSRQISVPRGLPVERFAATG